MSVKFLDALLSPNVVNVGTKFVISVKVIDDDFEFAASATAYDEYQGFADEAQTIGGKLVST